MGKQKSDEFWASEDGRRHDKMMLATEGPSSPNSPEEANAEKAVAGSRGQKRPRKGPHDGHRRPASNVATNSGDAVDDISVDDKVFDENYGDSDQDEDYEPPSAKKRRPANDTPTRQKATRQGNASDAMPRRQYAGKSPRVPPTKVPRKAPAKASNGKAPL